MTIPAFYGRYIDHRMKAVWPITCTLLKRMTCLQILRISLSSRPMAGNGAWKRNPWPVLEPLCALVSVPDFLVEVAPSLDLFEWWLEFIPEPHTDIAWGFYKYPIMYRKWLDAE
jgi:hypothetical protein